MWVKMKQSLSTGDPIGSRVPKYLAIAREILDDIGGKYSHGDYLPSERTLRTAYEATPGTIRSALAVLNREGYVQTLPQRGTLVLGKAEVKQEIGAVVREQKADVSPDALQTIALVTPLDNYLVTMLARGVELESRRNGCRLMLCGTNTSIQARRDIAAASKCVKTSLMSLAESGVDGIIWWSELAEQNQDAARAIQSKGIPLIVLDNPVPGVPTDSVGVDDFNAGVKATTHLLHLGHKKIAFWGFCCEGYVNSVSIERLSGYLDAIHVFDGLPHNLSRLRSLVGERDNIRAVCELIPEALRSRVSFYDESHISDKDRLLKNLIVRKEPPTAVVVANDHVAYDFMRAVGSFGLSIPDDIALVSFGDIERDSLQSPFLTAIRQPFEEIGQRAVRALIERMEQPSMPVQKVQFMTELIVRQSSGKIVQIP